MPNHVEVYTALLLFAAFVNLLAAGVVYARFKLYSARYLLGMLLSLTLWALTYAIFWLRPDPSWRFFWLNATYFGVVMVAPFYFLFALGYTRKETYLPRWSPWVWFIVPLLMLILLWSDPWHHLFFGGLRHPADSSFFQGGIFFWFNVFYNYALIIGATVVLAFSAWQTRKHDHQAQLFVFLLGIFLPLLVNAGSVLKILPETGLDLTPLLFSLIGLALIFDFIYHNFGQTIPVSHALLLEHINAGFLLLGTDYQLLEFNRQAQEFLRNYGDLQLGMSMKPVLEKMPAHVQYIFEKKHVNEVVSWSENRFFEVSALPVREKEGLPALGYMFIWRDVTDRVNDALELKRINQMLRLESVKQKQLQAKLATLANQDALSGLYNRRYLQQHLPIILASAARRNSPVSVAFIDIDHFKRVNDVHGHAAGDQVLRQLGSFLLQSTRAADLICRYGGEEFVLIAPDADIHDILPRLKALHTAIQQLTFQYNGTSFAITVSIGLAAYPWHAHNMDELLHHADMALYAAKQQGRNRIIVYNAGLDKA